VKTLSSMDDATPFDVMRLDSDEPSRVVLFAVGAGGSPERHLPLRSASPRRCQPIGPKIIARHQ